MQLQPLIDEMIDDADVAEGTKATYRHALRALLTYLESQGEKPTIEALYERVLYDYRQWLRAEYSERTARAYLGIATRLMDWLDNHHGPLPFSVNRAIGLLPKMGRQKSYKRRPVDPNFHRVLNYYVNQSMPEKTEERLDLLRNRAIIAMLYDTACRVSELTALNRGDVLDGKADQITLQDTKGDKPRLVFIQPNTQALIRAYVEARSDNLRAPLFIKHSDGKRLSRSMVYHIVKVAAIQCGLEGVSPHSFRHQRAQDMLNSGMPVQWVATYLGHEHIDTTRIIYAWQTDPKQLREMVDKYGQREDV
jgi:integrase